MEGKKYDLSKGPVCKEESMKKKCDEQSLSEAYDALVQARSLADLGQEGFISNTREDENVYNLLEVIRQKIGVAVKFFDENELCGETEKGKQ